MKWLGAYIVVAGAILWFNWRFWGWLKDRTPPCDCRECRTRRAGL
jgi:hypothetical protein